MDTFNQSSNAKVNKTWVKAGTFDAGSRREDTSERGKLYKPQSSRFQDFVSDSSQKEKVQTPKVILVNLIIVVDYTAAYLYYRVKWW